MDEIRALVLIYEYGADSLELELASAARPSQIRDSRDLALAYFGSIPQELRPDFWVFLNDALEHPSRRMRERLVAADDFTAAQRAFLASTMEVLDTPARNPDAPPRP